MNTLYAFELDSDEAYNLEQLKEMLKEDEERTSYTLHVLKPKRGTGTFWCAELGEGFETGDAGCGLECSYYEPRNGKNGICKWHRIPHWPTGETITLNKADLK